MADITDNNRLVDILVPDGSNYEQVTPKSKASAITDSQGRTVQEHISNTNIHTPYETIQTDIGTAITNLIGGASVDYDTLYKLQTQIIAINEIIKVTDPAELDTLQEVVDFILNNKDLIDTILTEKVSYTDIVNNLDTPETQQKKALDARQGKVLKDLLNVVSEKLPLPWLPNKLYYKDVIAIVDNTMYLCLVQHTSSTDFNNDYGLNRWYKLNDDAFVGATGVMAGEKGLVPAPQIIDRTKFLKGDGTWSNLPVATTTTPGVVKADGISTTVVDGAMTVKEFIGATLSYDGTPGTVPTPTKDDINKFLRGNGVWSVLPSATSDTLGVVKPDNLSITIDEQGRLSYKRMDGQSIVFTWSPNKEFKQGDIVIYANSLWLTNQDHTTDLDFNANYYDLLAAYSKTSTAYRESDPITEIELVQEVQAKENLEILVKGQGQLLDNEYTIAPNGTTILFDPALPANTDVQVTIFTTATLKNISGAVNVETYPNLAEETSSIMLEQICNSADMLLITVRNEDGSTTILQSSQYSLGEDKKTVSFNPPIQAGATVEFKIFTNEKIMLGTSIFVDSFEITQPNTTVLPLSNFAYTKNLIWVNIGNTDTVITEFELGADNKSIVLKNPLEVGDFGHIRYFTNVTVAQSGVTFTPHTDNNILTFTNDGAKENPAPIDFNQYLQSAEEFANQAEQSATNAEASATSVGEAATIATQQATIATEQATIATTKANEAKISETNSSISAGQSATSATASANSATASANSATESATHASNAQTSATTALGYSNQAKDWANKTGETVDGTEYSAKHYSEVAKTFVDETVSTMANKDLNNLTATGESKFSTNPQTMYQTQNNLTTGSIVLNDNQVIYYKEITEDITFTFDVSSLTKVATQVCTFELHLLNTTSSNVVFPDTVKWLNEDEPSVDMDGYHYLFAFRTFDGGANWVGNMQGYWI